MIPGSLAMMAAGGGVYRYLRFHQTANVGASNIASLWEIDYSADEGTTYVPTSAMTSNSAPSPLVASADMAAASEPAYKAFDSLTSGFSWKTTNDPHPHWLTIDLGPGNEIAPNRVRFVTSNDGNDFTPKDFTIQGSNTGAFTGEQVTLFTKTNEVTQPDKTTMTYTI